MKVNMKYETINLSRRLTHHYRAGWSYLDETEEVGNALRLSFFRTDVYDDSGYHYIHTEQTIMVEGDHDHKIVCEAIHDSYGGSNCQHEHDCCGCWSTSVHDIEVMDGGMYAFTTSSAQNY